MWVGMERMIERWLAAGQQPRHRRPEPRQHRLARHVPPARDHLASRAPYAVDTPLAAREYPAVEHSVFLAAPELGRRERKRDERRACARGRARGAMAHTRPAP